MTSEPESERWMWRYFHPFAKWWAETVRNLVVVAALVFIADKSGSQSLKILAYATAFIFVLYCFIYLQGVVDYLVDRTDLIFSSRVKGILWAAIIGVSMVASVGLTSFLITVVQEASKTYAR